MSNPKIMQFVEGLKSRSEEKRVKAAMDLQRYVTTELREQSLDEFLSFLDEFNHHIFEMISSNDINEKKGGIYAIMSLVDVDVGQKGQRISRFANYLRNLFNSVMDIKVMELTAKAVGRLALASGTLTAEYVEDLVKRSFEWLQGDRNEGRRHAAVLVLRELALSVPTYFFQQVQQFLDVIFNAVRDPKPAIREGAVAALRVALTITAQRETKEIPQIMWYKQCLTEVWSGFDDQNPLKDRNLTRDDRIHGSLLVLNELLRCSNNEWESLVQQLSHLTHCQAPPPKKEGMSSMMSRLRRGHTGSLSSSAQTPHEILNSLPSYPASTISGSENSILDQPCESTTCRDLLLEKYDSICTQVLNQRTSKNGLIQSALLQILPRLAALNKDKFAESYLSATMSYLLTCLRGREKERPTAFITLGLLAVAVGPPIKKYLKQILEVIKASLPSKETPTKKRAVEPSVYVCVSLVAGRAVGPGPLRAEVRELLEPMMATGLSLPLTLALQELAQEIPALKRDIAEGLLRMLSQVLMQRSTPRQGGTPGPPASPDHTDNANIVLALRTLGSFDFEGTGQSLMQFVRHVADHYLNSEQREIRLEAVRTCCQLLRPTFVAMGRRSTQTNTHIIFSIVSKVLWVTVTDMDSDVRLCVLASLDESFDSHLAQPENLNALIYALSDEVFEIRVYAISILGRLSGINPAYVHPFLRKALLKILDELDYSGIGRNRELSAHMLCHLIANAPRFMRQFVQAIMSVLVPKLKDQDPNPAVTTCVLMAIGDLAQVSGGEMQKWIPELLPRLLEMLEDSGWKRRVALWTLGQLVENTGYVVHPYTQYPSLLDILLSFLKTEQQPAVRRETIRVLGLLGALDPYKHKMNTGMIKIQEDTGVAVISITETKTDELTSDMGTSEMLVNLNYSSLEEFYPACAIAMLMKVIKDPTLAQHHNEVVRAVTFIFKSLGVKGVPYLAQVIPSLLSVIRQSDASFRDYLFQQLATLIGIVKQHIRNYLTDIIQVLKEFWVPGGKMETTITIISVVESIALAVGSEFKIYLKELIPMILKSFINDSKEKQVTAKLLLAFQKFGATLEEFLHMILPHIVKLFDATDVPYSVRKSALETIDHFSDYLDLSDYTSRIIHPLLRTLDTTPELRTPGMEVLCAVATQLGRSYECFIPLVHRITTKHKIHHPRYDILVAKVVKGLTVTDDELNVITAHQRARRPKPHDHQLETDTATIKKSAVGVQGLQRAWVFQRLVSKDDWLEWLRRFSIELMRASPSPALRACYSVSTTYVQLSRDLFNTAFVSCWSELNETLQDDLLQSLRQALTSQDIPEITQTLLNLAEFMEHCDKGPLPLELTLLGEKAMECRAYAKALHYKEEEFHKGPTSEVLEHLISINNKLGQKEAAAGLLEYARKNKRTDMKVQERWFEKLHDWDQALAHYQTKLETRPDDLQLIHGQMRCLEALGEWGELYTVSCERWNCPTMNEEWRTQMSRVSSASAWAMGEWTMMEEYTKFIPRDTQEGAFYRAVLATHKDQYALAQQLIDSARDLLERELTAMVGESYQRAYNAMVAVQMLAELEEVIQFKLVPERRQPITQIWWDRLQGCQRVVEDWQKILQVRSLVLSPQEDMRPWLKFAALCRKSGRLTLSHKTLVRLLGYDHTSTPQQALPVTQPEVTYQYCKHMYTSSSRRLEAFGQLQTFLQNLAHHVGGQNGDTKLRKLVSRVYLKMGDWYEELNGLNEENINTILTYYTHAKDTDEACYKAWHAYAYMNFEAILFYKNRADAVSAEGATEEANTTPRRRRSKSACDFTVAAVRGFIRSISLSDGNSLQDTLRLLTVWFQYGHQQGVYEALVDGLKTIHNQTWLQVIPQLIARIDTSKPLVGKLIHQLLMDIGKHHPQALIYPLTVAAKSSVPARAQAAEKVLKNMREHSANLVSQAMMVSEELIRVAILWHERWYEGLEEASRLYFGERNESGMFRTLEPLHALMERGPQTLKEMSFNQAYGRDLQEAQEWCKRYQRSGSVRDLNQAWDLYYHVFRRISRQLPQLTSLELQSVSPRLLKCRDLDIAVPGSYAPNSSLIQISYVQASLQILSSKQRPRKLCIRGSIGRDFMFLLKGHEDLRQDERVMQLFGLVNTLLIGNPDTFRRNLTIQRFAVIPLSTNSGLIGWVPHCDTLHLLIRDWREKKKIMLNLEHRIMMRMAQDLEHLCLMQKVEVFEHALELTQGDDLAKLLWFKSPSSEVWFDRRTNYTRSLAVMSMVGYVLGLGDRHPSNLMLDQQSGKIIHIDFGDCFEVAITREKFPEKIPFRLTRMLINAMEVTGIDGTYRMTCESVMALLRRNKDSLMAMLEAFVYDPLLNWRLMDTTTPKSKQRSVVAEGVTTTTTTAGGSETPIMDAVPASTSGMPVGSQSRSTEIREVSGSSEALNKKAVAIVNRVRDKLTGRDFSHEESLDVHKQVELLIAQATSHENLCQCYIGWCPFW